MFGSQTDLNLKVTQVGFYSNCHFTNCSPMIGVIIKNVKRLIGPKYVCFLFHVKKVRVGRSVGRIFFFISKKMFVVFTTKALYNGNKISIFLFLQM